ncbi:MAG: septum formation initiator family protein [Eubacterium sp.]|nr:septum formation initiator family protein [Eubacterium sp.]
MKKKKNDKKKNSKQFNDKFKKRFFSVKTGLLIALTLVIVLCAGIASVRLSRQARQYEKQIDELSTEVSKIKKENSALEEEKDNIDSEEFKESVARERLGMVGKDEYVLEQSEEGETSSEATTEEAEEKSTEK